MIKPALRLVILRPGRMFGALIGRPITAIFRRALRLRPRTMIKVAILLRSVFLARPIVIVFPVVHMPARLIVGRSLRTTAIVGTLLAAWIEGTIFARWSGAIIALKPPLVWPPRSRSLLVPRWSLAVSPVKAALIRTNLSIPMPVSRRSIAAIAIEGTLLARWWSLTGVPLKPLTVAGWRPLARIPIEPSFFTRGSLPVVAIKALTIAGRRA